MVDTAKFTKILQNKFPLVSRPFRHMATTLVIEEEEIIDYVRRLKSAGIIRRIGPLFSPKAHGYQTLLVALQTHTDKEDGVVDYLNGHSTITHNYRRAGNYNLWFTYAYKNNNEKKDLIKTLRETFGIDNILELPSVKTYKLKTEFRLDDIDLDELPPAVNLPESDDPLMDIPIIPSPFQTVGERDGKMEEEIILEIMQGMESGHIKRFGAIFNHTKAGLTSNALVVWKILDDIIDDVGESFTKETFISHCYQRAIQPNWPYNLYTMIHARSDNERDGFIRQLQEDVRSLTDDYSFETLDTLEEYKKTSFIPLGR